MYTEPSGFSDRASALQRISNKTTPTIAKDYRGNMTPISSYFGECTFGLAQMREKLPKEAYAALLRTLEKGEKMSSDTANAIAIAIKEWAVSKGATHYCHWFQPMTGTTAEKHDAFISIQHAHHSELKVMERFTGSQLIQGEPDASSFPSGGMRSTFEARGYTVWDPTPPLFIIEGTNGHTLCIPSVFFGYHGQALDNKTPLLRSVNAVSREAVEFLKLLGDVDCKSIMATLGAEQEYFLIDKEFAALRPDIVMTGRTLLGAPPPRGQQLEDHYFGAIPVRVKAFMEDAERELFRLGIPVKTRHNEVAPSQFELAPIFENINISTDHNTLTMDTLKRVALRHGFVCLLHEKPFAGLNGSGKHCNWSLSNDKGENLLEPGSTPHQNLRFLAVTAVVLKAVHDHADILRAAIASPGNDHRLGGNEAPPAIISVFLGSLLSEIFETIEQGKAAQATNAQIINLGVGQIPSINRDYTDRNRTSPFAFTGNKFEFRAVGSSANTAVPVTYLNAAVASVFSKATVRLKELLTKKSNRDEAVMELIQQLFKESKNVVFEGNGYSEEWRAEAKRRGLPIMDRTIDALPVMNRPESVEFLSKMKVFSSEEVASRYHIAIERYEKTVLIELDMLCELTKTHVIPAVERQLKESASIHSGIRTSTLKSMHAERVEKLEAAYELVLTHLDALTSLIQELDADHSDIEAKARLIGDRLVPVAAELRSACDACETLVADDLWVLPKYREILFANHIS